MKFDFYRSGSGVAFNRHVIPTELHGHSVHVVGAVYSLCLGDLLGVDTLKLDDLDNLVATIEFNDLTLGLELPWVL